MFLCFIFLGIIVNMILDPFVFVSFGDSTALDPLIQFCTQFVGIAQSLTP